MYEIVKVLCKCYSLLKQCNEKFYLHFGCDKLAAVYIYALREKEEKSFLKVFMFLWQNFEVDFKKKF
jgi:hypothetical protein